MTNPSVEPELGQSFEELAMGRFLELVPNADAASMSLVHNVTRLANRIVADIESHVHFESGWSWAGFRIMFVTMVYGELEPRQISKLSDVSRASVSSVLNTLERDGFVVRLRESEDRRLVTVRLTKRGEEAVVQAFAAHNQRETEWTSSLSKAEAKQLTKLVRKMLAGGP